MDYLPGLGCGAHFLIAAPGHVRWCRGRQIGIQFAEPFDVASLAQPEPAREGFDLVKPDYLKSELDPNSPWAARWERLMAEDL